MGGLIVVDVGGTLGTFDKPSVADILFGLSKIADSMPGKRDIVTEAERHFTHTRNYLTRGVIADLCGALLIDIDQWPDPWPRFRFTPYPYAAAALQLLRQWAPVVALSNISVLSAEDRMSDVRAHFGDLLGDIYTSCNLGLRKPDARLWTMLANEHRVPVDRVIHIGDQYLNDTCGAIYAGARAIMLTGTREHLQSIPLQQQWPASIDRMATAHDLRHVNAIVNWWESERVEQQ